MKVGLVVPQGFQGEYAGWTPERAWARTLQVARAAERHGADTIWVFDHLGTFGTLRDEPTLEAFAVLQAIAGTTTRPRLGPLVARVGLRNPALLAKIAATLDVASGGRLDLGLGAGSSEREAKAFGYRFDPFPERIALLRETLQVLRPLFADGRATFHGTQARTDDAILNPRGAQQPRIPLIVGGNSRSAWRAAAEFADELNLDGPTPDEAKVALREIAALCESVGRAPGTLAVSVHLFPKAVVASGPERADLFAAYAELGISRVMALLRDAHQSDEVVAAYFEDVRAADAHLA
jgi:alkanesulfonate monooxygenase SsuD/methylene tetrahydromethanopterin reductase-like flavin-dependent oxidoreductase (luciferase family)